MDELDRAIVNNLQGGFPIGDHPFRDAAERLGTTEAELLARIGRLLESGVLTRFGPLYQVEKLGGAFTLAAMAVPDDDFERIAAVVNAFPEVAHNYARSHRLNMWFVLATETPDGVTETIDRIERATGLPVLNFPKEAEYFVDLRFSV